VFAFAGLYTAADTGSGVPATCTIITTMPNDLVASIHNRMPAILERDDEGRWADARVTDPATVLPCLRPLPSSLMEGYPVSTLVSSPANDGPHLRREYLMQTTRMELEKWLIRNNFAQLPTGKTSHKQFVLGACKVTVPGHGSKDLSKKHLGMILRHSSCRFRPRKVQRGWAMPTQWG
jgi:predicted RNA binding protein YcfA (HicA-like mRNA interferase family)